jgi:uncharacterized protein YkwD
VTEPVQVNGLLVQYFQRARMEYHPEVAAQGYGVELSLLGRDALQRSASADRSASSRGSAPAARTMTSFEQDLFNRVNEARRAAGLAPVAYDPRLGDIAFARSDDMATRNYFSHDGPNGNNYANLLSQAHISYTRAGEIIAWNTYDAGQTSLQTFNGFMHSPPHHDIIMTPDYNYAGVGVVRDAPGKYYYTMIFIHR